MIASAEANQSHAHDEERHETPNSQGPQFGQSDDASSHRHSEKSIRHLGHAVRNRNTTKNIKIVFDMLIIAGLPGSGGTTRTKFVITRMVKESCGYFWLPNKTCHEERNDSGIISTLNM